jgi:hypothetical protein
MASLFILIFTLLVYKLFTYKACNNFKLPLFFFTLLFLIYNCYPFLLLDFKYSNKYHWEKLSIQMDIMNLKILLLLNFFYLFFLVGYKLSFLLTEKIKLTYSIKYKIYNFSLKIILLLFFAIFLIFYGDIIFRSLQSYQDNIEISKDQLYSYLKFIFLFLISIILCQEKKITNYRIILFIFFIVLFSFFSSDKDPFLHLFVLLFFIYYNKNSFNSLNLLKFSILLSIVLFIFLPFFTYFRTFRYIEGFYEFFVLRGEHFISDTAGPLLSLKLITENIVTLDTNFFDILISFLPHIARELFSYQDLAVEFAKIVLGPSYIDGHGFGFSMISESYLYFKKNIFLFIFFVISSGFVYNFFIQLISKTLVPQKLSLYILSAVSLQLSFSIVRDSYAALTQSSMRFLIFFAMIGLIYFFLKILNRLNNL